MLEKITEFIDGYGDKQKIEAPDPTYIVVQVKSPILIDFPTNTRLFEFGQGNANGTWFPTAAELYNDKNARYKGYNGEIFAIKEEDFDVLNSMESK